MGLHDHFLKFVNGIVRWSSNFSNFSEIHEDSASKSYWSNKGAAKQLIGHYCASWQSGQAPSAVILALVTGIMSIKSGVVKIHRKCQQLEKFVWNKPTNIWFFLYQSVKCDMVSTVNSVWDLEGQNSTLIWCICKNPKATNWKAYRNCIRKPSITAARMLHMYGSTPTFSSSFDKSDQDQPWKMHPVPKQNSR